MDEIIVLDFGGQYCHLITRRIRDLGVYSEIYPYDIDINTLKSVNPKGIVLSGGPNSVYDEDVPQLSEKFYEFVRENKIALLGICYGHHLIIHQNDGKVQSQEKKEYGKTEITVVNSRNLFKGMDTQEIVWMSHGDQIIELPEGYEVLAKSKTSPIAAYGNDELRFYGVQFHPEVVHTPKGNIILNNFVEAITGAKKEWKLKDWIANKVEEIRNEIGPDSRVVLGLSGGVDSSVTAVLLHKAIGDRLHCIFVNNGLLRKNEEIEVQNTFKDLLGFKNFYYIDAEHLFLNRLAEVVDPEEKRKIIGHTFIEVFENKTKELESSFPNIEFLAQGTIYPDRVETAATSKVAAKIKSHHNLTLPEKMKLKIIEPIKDLYKDEVRRIGRQLTLPNQILDRHPFPGPGLAVRCLGKITKERLDTLREADAIFIEEIKKAGVYNDIWQAFCVFLPVKSVGVMGDFRTYENICAVRAVNSIDGMTSSFSKLDWDLLETISTRIINEVKGFNRVVYDISNKPPSTIEFE